MATPLSTSIQAPVAADGSVDISMTWQGVLPVLLALVVNSNSVGTQYARRELGRMAKCADLLPGALNQLAPLADSRAPDLVSITECRPYSKRKAWRLVEVLRRAEESGKPAA